MLELVNIVKDYSSGDTLTHALKGLNVSFRRNEFVSVLGPSGCGKTTLLNIIGGLDRYTSGDLIIKGKSTKNYTDRDWDTYRNHSVGFVFQSYNLISHLSILGNVELALTIGGISRKERTEKAIKALESVGLGDIYKKKPNQLSGGQMQRVAIARALVNDPEIVLADEPTGALDSETSIQIMELLKEVAKDRLVIMVTHNPELAKTYSNRIITMKDGLMISDSKPFVGKEKESEVFEALPENSKKAKMSLATAFTLSSKNLVSKIKRTSLVVVAGSIGIIGVSAVLAISYGVKSYIGNMQDDMLSGNPVSITETALDLSSMLSASDSMQQLNAVTNSTEDGKINIKYMIEYLAKQQNNLSTYAIKNDISKDYVQFVDEMPSEYYNAIQREYGINPKLNMYTDVQFTDPIGKIDQVSLTEVESMYTAIIKETSFGEFASMISSFTNTFFSMPDNPDYVLSQYDVLNEGGYVAKEDDEMMLVVSKNTELTDIFLGQIGYYTQDQFVDVIDKFADADNHQDLVLSPTQFDYDTLLNKKFTYYPNDSIYDVNPYNVVPGTNIPFTYKGEISDETTLAKGKEMKITAILRAKENVSYGCLETGFVLSPKFEQKMLIDSDGSAITASLKEAQTNYPSLTEEQKTAYNYLVAYSYDYSYRGTVTSDKVDSAISIVNPGSSSSSSAIGSIIEAMFGDKFSVESQFKTAIRKVAGNNLTNDISVYPISFDDKHLVTDYLDQWNNKSLTITLSDKTIAPTDRSDVTYADNLQVVISMINSMIEIVTIALICFTSLSLVVSTVMIGIITYVSVIERIKEIGIIRSLGGRKLDVSNLFNVETFIIGASSGAFGLVITYIICLIVNIVINSFVKVGTLMILPWNYAIIIVLVSIALTLISGLIPAVLAARKDPVVALRSND
jgi:putative ABC transport system permease protein